MPLVIYIILNICIAAFTATLSFYKSRTTGGRSILGISISTLLCYGTYLQFALSPSELTETIRDATYFFVMTLAAITLFTFSLELTSRSHWIGRITILLLVIIPVFTQTIYWNANTIALFQHRFSLSSIFASITLIEKVNILYRYSLLAATVWLLGRALFHRSGMQTFQFWSMMIGPIIAFITQGLTLLEVQLKGIDEIYLVSINISAIGFAYNIFRHKSNLGLQVRRELVVDNMVEGWIVLDEKNSIIDFNQATTKLIGMQCKNLYGTPITTVLPNFPDVHNMMRETQEVELDKSFRINDEYYYLQIRISTIQNGSSAPTGYLIIWCDITNRRRAEDARQHARDEMFVLLNAISNVASQTTNLEEFLSDAIYQIIYPFRSQMVLIYLKDDKSNGSIEQGFYLAAHMGLSTDSSKKFSILPTSEPLFIWFNENNQPLLIEDLQDYRTPKIMGTLSLACLLVIPLFVRTRDDQKTIGFLILGRNDDPVYMKDEIIRLNILADQIATLIDSDRRRKLSIAISERQRLMRDIHDSVSQKLYGLVTLTEAAQAAIEAKYELDINQYLSRIGLNARQAVKELRLFLFQMQPVDLEKEGLVSVIHHRLAAVEGRADIKVRFLADEPIIISKNKEVALYYIAQEALNNVLRHAFATSVSVLLKQGYKYVTFEVRDDGRGFEMDKLDRGGLGLKNIEERVKQENGKLKILSNPGKGTIIRVIFDRDLPNKS
jgi:PAS domain S-box-containing protein